MEDLACPARLVEDDDRGHCSETELKARAGKRFGAEQQDQQCSDGNEAQADRLAPKRYPPSTSRAAMQARMSGPACR
jgi:hypothetical protein